MKNSLRLWNPQMHDAASTLLADDEPLYLVQDVSLAHRNRLR